MPMFRKLSRRAKVVSSLVIAAATGISGCTSAPSFVPPPRQGDGFLRERATTKEQEGFRVSAAFLSVEEAVSIFGVDLHERGIQPLWLEIENDGEKPAYFLPSGLDPEYFAPLELGFLFEDDFSDYTALGEHLEAVGFDSRSPILPGATVSGFVYTNEVNPSLVAEIDLIGRQWSKSIALLVPVPGTEHAQGRIAEMTALYGPEDLIEVDGEDELRSALERLPCCSTDEDGAAVAPLNLVLMGGVEEVAPAFVRRGYRYGAASPMHALGRVHDFASRKQSHWVAPQPHTVRLWLTPLRYQGRPILLGQVSSRLGGRFASDGNAHLLEPNVDEARNDVVQDLMYSQMLAKVGFVEGAGKRAANGSSDSETYTDGLRAVLVFEGMPRALSEIDFFDWDRLADHRRR